VTNTPIPRASERDQQAIPRASERNQQAIPVFVPYLGTEVREAATGALDAGWLSLGPLTRQFEEALQRYLGEPGRPVVTASSGTASLHLAALSAGVGRGDEVIMPSFTYIAGHQAIGQTGADIVLCDIEDETLGADPESVRSLISGRTKAIVVTHYAGFPCRLDEILALAAERGIRVIDDAAHALGTRSKGRMIGSFGDLTAFSFGPVKIITTLEGGAVVAPSVDDTQPLHEWRLLGVDQDTAARYARGRAWEYDVTRQGYRYHLGSVPSAIGLSQLQLIDTFIANRQSYCRRYHEAFAGIDGIRLVGEDFTDISPFIYVIRVSDRDTRTALIAHLEGLGVKTGIHWALGAHHFTHFKACRRSDLAVTERACDEVLTLPLHSFMDDAVLDRVIDGVRSFFP
jgi:dTDP-4-amino-4,6-dideoxygalactose transaminase